MRASPSPPSSARRERFRRDIRPCILLRLCRATCEVPSLLCSAHARMGLHRRHSMLRCLQRLYSQGSSLSSFGCLGRNSTHRPLSPLRLISCTVFYVRLGRTRRRVDGRCPLLGHAVTAQTALELKLDTRGEVDKWSRYGLGMRRLDSP
jgi:hypothetical protein